MDSSSQNAIDMLVADHEEVKVLFKKFDGLSDRSKSSKKKLADEICAALAIHAQLEEEIFYPRVRAKIKDHDLMDEALVEHASAKGLMAQIREMDPGDDLYDAKVSVLSEQVAHHVGEEEGTMFQKVKESGIDLNALGEEIRIRRQALVAVVA